MPVNQNIQNFYRTAADKDFSRDFLFRVTQMQLQGVPALEEGDLIYVKTASLPGRNITNVAVPYMGLNLNIPGTATYPGSEAYSLSLYLDADSNLRNYFETASRSLFDDQTSTGEYGTPDDDFFIQLAQLDKDLEPIAEYKLIGASLRSVNNIQYNIAGGTGTTVAIDATVSYHFYTKER
tara:strand:- start:3631 stop:4170 length:540 start_codon:yes stop_codon:yes gene_type:complete